MKNALKFHIDFMKSKKLNYFITSFLCIISLLLIFTKGLNLGIDFSGGIVMELSIKDDNFNLADLRSKIHDLNLGETSVYNTSSVNEVAITIGKDTKNDQEKSIDYIKSSLSSLYKNIEYNKIDFVGPKAGKELIMNGVIAVIISFVGMFIYLWSRFNFEYSIGATLALVHDAIVTMGFFSLTGLTFDLTSIAALLTIVGYSVNDSVVIYDRIRDNIRKLHKMPFIEIINRSINETLGRTIFTVVTVLLANLSLIIFGGEVIRSFSIAMFFGIIIGTYSSIYLSAPMLIDLKK